MTDYDPGPIDIFNVSRKEQGDFWIALIAFLALLFGVFSCVAEVDEPHGTMYGVMFKCPEGRPPSGITTNDPQVIQGAVSVYLGNLYPEQLVKLASKNSRPVIIEWLKICLDYELKEEA